MSANASYFYWQRGGGMCVYLPVGVDDLAEGQLTAHLQVALVLLQVIGRTLGRVHLTVLI